MDNNNSPVWFITGCSTGFGRALAKLILGRGWRAVITARNIESVQDLLVSFDDTALALTLDVNNKEQIADSIALAKTKFGRIDVLVNNAGFGYFSSIEEGEEAKIRSQFDTNVFGLINMIQAVLPGMREQKSGHIINFSSIGGLVGFTATGFYHATKFAVEGLSESLAKEIGPLGIKVLLVEPGPFRTDWAGRSTARTDTKIADYESTVATRMAVSLEGSGKQKGDPIRGCEAIIAAVESETPQLRLLLGKMAYDLAIEKTTSLKQNFEAWKTLSLSADFPD